MRFETADGITSNAISQRMQGRSVPPGRTDTNLEWDRRDPPVVQQGENRVRRSRRRRRGFGDSGVMYMTQTAPLWWMTLARPPYATAIVAMVRAIYSLCRPRLTTPGTGLRPAISASVTL